MIIRYAMAVSIGVMCFGWGLVAAAIVVERVRRWGARMARDAAEHGGRHDR